MTKTATRTISAALAALMATTNFAWAAGPSQSEVDRCVRNNFSHTNPLPIMPLPFVKVENHLCPEYMEIENVSIDDMMVNGNIAQVKAVILFRLTQRVSGSSFVAQSCAGGTYGDQNQMFEIGARWRNPRTITMQRWTSGWKC